MTDAPSVRADTGLSLVEPVAVPEPVRHRGISAAVWSTLLNSTFPGARPESVILVLDYCAARQLDPLKKPCHIVPMEVRDAKTNTYTWRDVILPGIYELRTTAQRTTEYLGHTPPTWGPDVEYKGVKAFEWCALTMLRFHAKTPDRPIEFPVRCYFREVVVLNRDGKPNARWTRAPLQMLLKCTEAAGLREAFPDAIGGEHAAEEIDGRHVDRDEPPAPDAWGDKPSAITESLRQALRATGAAVKPPEPPPTPPPPADAPLPPQAVTITGVEPGRPGSRALGSLTHSGSAEPIAYARELHEAVTAARAAGVPVVLDIGRAKGDVPYVKGIRSADDESPF